MIKRDAFERIILLLVCAARWVVSLNDSEPLLDLNLQPITTPFSEFKKWALPSLRRPFLVEDAVFDRKDFSSANKYRRHQLAVFYFEFIFNLLVKIGINATTTICGWCIVDEFWLFHIDDAVGNIDSSTVSFLTFDRKIVELAIANRNLWWNVCSLLHWYYFVD